MIMTPKDVLVYISYGLILKRAYNWAHLKWDCAKLYATLTNCGNRLKLQLPSRGRNTRDGQGNDPGYGKSGTRLANPQPSHLVCFNANKVWKVQRLDGSGLQPKQFGGGLRYSPAPTETCGE